MWVNPPPVFHENWQYEEESCVRPLPSAPISPPAMANTLQVDCEMHAFTHCFRTLVKAVVDRHAPDIRHPRRKRLVFELKEIYDSCYVPARDFYAIVCSPESLFRFEKSATKEVCKKASSYFVRVRLITTDIAEATPSIEVSLLRSTQGTDSPVAVERKTFHIR